MSKKTMTQQEVNQKASSQPTSDPMSRKVHKADREKLRRDKLNEQFAELAAVLDPEKPKHDKAGILGESLQAVKDLRMEIKRLKMERGTLYDESRELNREKDDLEEEKAALKKQTDELELQVQQVLKASMALGSNGNSYSSPPQLPQPPFGYPSYVQFRHPYVPSPSLAPTHVERPCARYPAPDVVPDFLSKVQQSNRGFQRVVSRPRVAVVAERYLGCSSEQDDSDTQLHLGQPRLSSGGDTGDEVDTDLQLKVPASSKTTETPVAAHARSS